MKYNIFPMFYSQHRTYSNIFTIFRIAQIWIYNFKQNSSWSKKEKKEKRINSTVLRPAQQPGAQAGPRALPLPLSLLIIDGGPHLSASSSSSRHWLDCAQERCWRGPSSRGEAPRVRLLIAAPLTLPTDALPLSSYPGHTHGGRRHWSHADRPQELARARTNVLESFQEV